MTAIEACDPCLRRTQLVALLAVRIERAARGRGAYGRLLALHDDELIAAMRAENDIGLQRAQERFDPDEMRSRCAALGMSAFCRHAPGYPARLLDLDDPPAMVHVYGDPDALAPLCAPDHDVPAVAVVGARRASSSALDVARLLGRELARAGLTVVSGMALGIDSAAHEGALAGGGRTIAVLGGGADNIYPASKHSLHGRIRAQGCVVSELPPGFKAMRWTFPARNRLIAALAAAVVVVQGRERSGSLITADLAADLGRPVGAVPGAVNEPRNAGSNALLAEGAAVVRGAGDVLDLLAGLPVGGDLRASRAAGGDGVAAATGRSVAPARAARPAIDPSRASPPPRRWSPSPDLPLEPALREALEAVDDGADSPDRLAHAMGGDVAAATIALTRLELAGVLRRERDGSFSRRAR